MKNRFHVIYIPGFGDRYDIGRRLLFSCWRLLGVTTEFVAMNWRSAESYEDKLARINDAVDQAQGKRVILIGESAGASMTLAIHAKRHGELYKTVTISGKNRHANTVSPKLYLQYAAFQDAMRTIDRTGANLSDAARQNFVTFYPLYDGVIPIEDTRVPGTRMIRLFSAGHFFTIFLCLTVFSWYVLAVAKRT